MSAAIDTVPDVASDGSRGRREVIYRHTFLVRLTHWLNALTIIIMIGSGLNIFNAHPNLYWGQKGADSDPPFIEMTSRSVAGQPHGVTHIGGLALDTTGVLGLSRDQGQLKARGYPAWLTLPSYRGDLVNGPEFTREARTPDPQRLLRGYERASLTLNFIRSPA